MSETRVVEFVGWQEGAGRVPSCPLFTIHLPGHPLDKSTVSLATLLAHDLPVPAYPERKVKA